MSCHKGERQPNLFRFIMLTQRNYL